MRILIMLWTRQIRNARQQSSWSRLENRWTLGKKPHTEDNPYIHLIHRVQSNYSTLSTMHNNRVQFHSFLSMHLSNLTNFDVEVLSLQVHPIFSSIEEPFIVLENLYGFFYQYLTKIMFHNEMMVLSMWIEAWFSQNPRWTSLISFVVPQLSYFSTDHCEFSWPLIEFSKSTHEDPPLPLS